MASFTIIFTVLESAGQVESASIFVAVIFNFYCGSFSLNYNIALADTKSPLLTPNTCTHKTPKNCAVFYTVHNHLIMDLLFMARHKIPHPKTLDCGNIDLL